MTVENDMSNVNPLLEDGMVVHIAKNTLHKNRVLVYSVHYPNGFEGDFQVVCFPDSEDVFRKLGFPLTPHWNNEAQQKGFLAVGGVDCEGYDTEEYFEKSIPDIHPIVQSILTDSFSNKSFASLLEADTD